jgi:hypothetical protein
MMKLKLAMQRAAARAATALAGAWSDTGIRTVVVVGADPLYPPLLASHSSLCDVDDSLFKVSFNRRSPL